MSRVTIIQGDYRVETNPGVTITTLLGSCISVCLHDSVARVGGMNHFLLGAPGENAVVSAADRQRYGVHAMELLINEMMKHGAARSRLRAHLYGGATIVAALGAIGESNVKFAREFIRTEGIAISHCDLGGKRARKVEFRPHAGLSRSTLVSDVVPILNLPARHVTDGELELF